jgi:hypothetical protein
MSEKTTSITEAIQSGDNIPPAVYQMWIEDLIREREVLIKALRYYEGEEEFTSDPATAALIHVGEFIKVGDSDDRP